jgi:hypothetical protein
MMRAFALAVGAAMFAGFPARAGCGSAPSSDPVGQQFVKLCQAAEAAALGSPDDSQRVVDEAGALWLIAHANKASAAQHAAALVAIDIDLSLLREAEEFIEGKHDAELKAILPGSEVADGRVIRGKASAVLAAVAHDAAQPPAAGQHPSSQ